MQQEQGHSTPMVAPEQPVPVEDDPNVGTRATQLLFY
jgi:hypothetical protein